MSPTLIQTKKLGLIGNPNAGKSSLFNQLTGLRQHTGNYPGVTVDITEGEMRLSNGMTCQVLDLPGAYSLYPNSAEERLVASVLTCPTHPLYPDAVVYVADPNHLEKHLLLLTQLMDLGLPCVLAVNMADVAEKDHIEINTALLAESLGIPVFYVSSRTGLRLESLLESIEQLLSASAPVDRKPFYALSALEKKAVQTIQKDLGVENPYRALVLLHHHTWIGFLDENKRQTLASIASQTGFKPLNARVDETMARYNSFTPLVHRAVKRPVSTRPENNTDQIDRVVTHRFLGPVLFTAVMLLVFQAIFDWSSYPMDWIEGGINWLSSGIQATLPEAWYTDLITDGLLAGLAGVLVFIPQIALLFFLIALLEEVGYMARVVFMFDRIMQGFGMNGRSIVALISSGACAVPAIMSSRTIGNWKERLITILVTPFISCSARIPVYAILIGLAVPATRVFGVISLQALVFGLMYVLGAVVALLSAFVLKKVFKSNEPSYLAIELPEYRMPHWKNVIFTVFEKVRSFVVEAGKIILIISVVLWALARFGPGENMELAEAKAETEAAAQQMDEAAKDNHIAGLRLEASYAGLIGKTIEPAIRPLGYDWKIGIALITSFAAREVFVGTMSTIYSLGSESEDDTALREKMAAATFSDSKKPVYTLATALSLLVFYALAMQCMSTLAVVKRETGTWKWPLYQFFGMTILAYIAAWATYNVVGLLGF